jgi:hypothetical protein
MIDLLLFTKLAKLGIVSTKAQLLWLEKQQQQHQLGKHGWVFVEPNICRGCLDMKELEIQRLYYQHF